jgi:hypothetical protein
MADVIDLAEYRRQHVEPDPPSAAEWLRAHFDHPLEAPDVIRQLLADLQGD